MKALLLSVILVIASCNGQKKVSLNDNEVTTGTHRLTLVLQDNYSGFDFPQTLVIRDVKALKKFYSKINRTRKPGIPIPNIDFTKEIVLVHCSGKQNAGTLSTLSILERTNEELVVNVSLESVERKKVVLAETTPFSIYKISATTEKIIFKKEE